jgi:hypothetical protein
MGARPVCRPCGAGLGAPRGRQLFRPRSGRYVWHSSVFVTVAGTTGVRSRETLDLRNQEDIADHSETTDGLGTRTRV